MKHIYILIRPDEVLNLTQKKPETVFLQVVSKSRLRLTFFPIKRESYEAAEKSQQDILGRLPLRYMYCKSTKRCHIPNNCNIITICNKLTTPISVETKELLSRAIGGHWRKMSKQKESSSEVLLVTWNLKLTSCSWII